MMHTVRAVAIGIVIVPLASTIELLSRLYLWLARRRR